MQHKLAVIVSGKPLPNKVRQSLMSLGAYDLTLVIMTAAFFVCNPFIAWTATAPFLVFRVGLPSRVICVIHVYKILQETVSRELLAPVHVFLKLVSEHELTISYGVTLKLFSVQITPEL